MTVMNLLIALIPMAHTRARAKMVTKATGRSALKVRRDVYVFYPASRVSFQEEEEDSASRLDII